MNNIEIITKDNGAYYLTINDTDDKTYALFEERGLQGGGYTWEGIVTSLIKMKMPEILPALNIGAEGDNMYIDCDSKETLEQIAQLINSAIEIHSLLIAAIENAGDQLE